jgi:hypothetical protein
MKAVNMGTWKDKIGRWRTYFFRGHGIGPGFALSYLSTMIIVYWYMMDNIPGVKTLPLFSHLIIFLIWFGAAYFIVCMLLGRWDMKRGTFKAESVLGWQENPFTKDMMDRIKQIELDVEEIKKLLTERK